MGYHTFGGLSGEGSAQIAGGGYEELIRVILNVTAITNKRYRQTGSAPPFGVYGIGCVMVGTTVTFAEAPIVAPSVFDFWFIHFVNEVFEPNARNQQFGQLWISDVFWRTVTGVTFDLIVHTTA